MKRLPMFIGFFAVGVVIVVGALLFAPHRTQAQGLGGNQEQQAAQAALEQNYPKLQANDQYLKLAIPGQTMGQTTGVATNSRGHIFVYSRSVNQGMARGGRAAILWEFDENYKFVKEWGPNNYAESFGRRRRPRG